MDAHINIGIGSLYDIKTEIRWITFNCYTIDVERHNLSFHETVTNRYAIVHWTLLTYKSPFLASVAWRVTWLFLHNVRRRTHFIVSAQARAKSFKRGGLMKFSATICRAWGAGAGRGRRRKAAFFSQHRDSRRQGWRRGRNVGGKKGGRTTCSARSSSLCMRVGGYTLLSRHARVR